MKYRWVRTMLTKRIFTCLVIAGLLLVFGHGLPDRAEADSGVTIPVRVGVIVSENNPGSGTDTELYESIEQVLAVNRIPWDVLELFLEKPLVDKSGNPMYSSLIILVPGYIINPEYSQSIVDCVNLGTGVVGVSPEIVNPTLAPLFGISSIGTEWLSIDTILIEADIFTFAYAGTTFKTPLTSSLDHQVEEDITITARSPEENRPVIWSHNFGPSRTVFFNYNALQSEKFQGLLLQGILYTMPAGLASPVNAGALHIDDCPSAYYGAEYLQEYYYDFVTNILPFLDSYNLKATAFLIFSYSGQINDFWRYPESVEGVYQFLQRGHEIGLHGGSNHTPLVPEYWGDEDAIDAEVQKMMAEIEHLASLLKTRYNVELGQIVSYAPPANEISDYGYKALDTFTDIKYVATIQDFGTPDIIEDLFNPSHRIFKQEQGTKIYNLPRTQGGTYYFSGDLTTDESYKSWVNLRSRIESGQPYLVFTHPVEDFGLDPVYYSDYSMKNEFSSYTAWADDIATNYPFYRWTTTASLGEILESRDGALNARWLPDTNWLEINEYNPEEPLQVKTSLFLNDITLEDNTLRLVFGDSPNGFLTSDYDVIKHGDNYFIYSLGTKALLPVVPDTPLFSSRPPRRWLKPPPPPESRKPQLRSTGSLLPRAAVMIRMCTSNGD